MCPNIFISRLYIKYVEFKEKIKNKGTALLEEVITFIYI